MADPLQVDVAAAEAALAAAGGMPDVIPSTGQDPFNRNAMGQFANKATEADTPVVAAVEPDADAATPEAGTVDEPVFTQIDDSVLSPELLQMKRSMQADYTRKTQEAAPWRKMSEELGIANPEDFRAAGEVYTRLQDPRNWPTIHKELTEFMTQAGMTPQQAHAAASDQIANIAPDTPDDFSDLYQEDGPDLSPLVTRLQQQSQQIQQLTQLVTGDQQKRAQELQYQTLAEGLTRMENTIRQQNPTYTQDDIDSVYNLMGNDGNLFNAQQKYESIIGARLSAYIQKKTESQHGQPSPVPGGGITVAAELSEDVRKDPDAMHAAAMAHIAALDREEATS